MRLPIAAVFFAVLTACSEAVTPAKPITPEPQAESEVSDTELVLPLPTDTAAAINADDFAPANCDPRG